MSELKIKDLSVPHVVDGDLVGVHLGLRVPGLLMRNVPRLHVVKSLKRWHYDSGAFILKFVVKVQTSRSIDRTLGRKSSLCLYCTDAPTVQQVNNH